MRPAIILRLSYYRTEVEDVVLSRLTSGTTDYSRFHGGWIEEEIASLLSLLMGIRLKAGSKTRVFFPDGDQKGKPEYGLRYFEPTLPKNTRGLLLPTATNDHCLNDSLPLLQTFPCLSPEASIVLIRATRLYQEAIWVAESTPELSWIMLVSAVESVANYWRTQVETPTERLRTSRPELEQILLRAGGQELLERVAQEIAPYMGSTKKFIDFILTFLPDPPPERPPDWLQVSWDKPSMKSMMNVIYNHRSKALHGGIPFPEPMCRPPNRVPGSQALGETPLGLGASALGGVWQREDIPLLLHTFELIVRGSLINWWRAEVQE